ncbi:testicular acid phosphatase-like [Ixodes scapularis]|uniref:testicular acid phosphatase-like n=1 Tax=Ixodes scapularis TaxID=6945 RepID=UPI001A9D7A54|nr:testicular acid phosphatase-like [Ixodes scapularis]
MSRPDGRPKNVHALQCPKNILYAFVISRHAQRTPVTDCTALLKSNPEQRGQLTSKGHEQAFRLGQFLRARYATLLSADKPGQVLATHNYLDRCRDSVEEIIRGLGVQATPVLDSTSYYVHFEESLRDNFDAVVRHPAKGGFETLGDMLEFVANKAGAQTEDRSKRFLAMDSLITNTLNGNPMPSWAVPHWDDFLWAERKMFGMVLSGHELSMARTVLTRILDTFSLKFEAGIDRPDKLHVFSLSDTSLFSVLKLFNQSYDDRPCFCASVFFEVFCEGGGKPVVQVLFATEENPHLVLLDKLENPAPLPEFMSFVRSVLVSNPI